MGVRIDTTVGALNAQRQAQQTGNPTVQSAQGAATARPGNRAADAKGLSLPDRFRTQIRALTQEVAGLQQGVSAIQVADKALSVQQGGLKRLQELAQRATDTALTPAERGTIGDEAEQILKNIDQTAEQTEFGGRKLLQPETRPNAPTPGPNPVTVNTSTTASLGVNALDLSAAEGAGTAAKALQSAIARVDQNRAGLNTQADRLTRSIQQRQDLVGARQTALTQVRDFDTARQAIAQTQTQASGKTGAAAVLAQSSLNPAAVSRLLGR